MPLRTGNGWKEVSPRPTGLVVAWEAGQKIYLAGTDFQNVREAGTTGPVDSAIAADTESGSLYRYTCTTGSFGPQRNEIVRISVADGSRSTFQTLHPLRWIPWFFAKVEEQPLLAGLVVTDASRPERPGVILQHQLGLFDLRTERSVYRRLPGGCQFPLAWDLKQNRILFHGPDGYQEVDLHGKRRLRLEGTARGDGRGGACFHPGNPTLVIGGEALRAYDPRTREHRILHPDAIMPRWDPRGESLYFSEHSGNLLRIPAGTDTPETLVAIANCTHPEIKHARPPTFSPDGCYLALPLTRRAPLSPDALQPGQPTWSERQTLLIADLVKQEIWQRPGPVAQCCLVPSSIS